MNLRVLHVIDSVDTSSGRLGVLFPGLINALSSKNIDSTMASNPDQLPSITSTSKPNIVHIHGWTYETAKLAAKASRKTSTPYIISPLGDLCDSRTSPLTWRKRLTRWLFDRPILNAASCITALNDIEADQLRKLINPRQQTTLPYGISVGEYNGESAAQSAAAQASTSTTNLVNKPTTPTDQRILLLLAPIEPSEGCVQLLKAMAELGPTADGWTIVLAGEEIKDYRKMLEAAIRRKGASTRVSFVNAPDVASQRQWLAKASLVVSPGLRVRPPVSMMQALAMGVPVLASRWMIPPGLESIIPMFDPTRSGLRSALQTMMTQSNEQLRTAAAQYRKLAQSIIDWSARIDAFIALYSNLAGRSP